MIKYLTGSCLLGLSNAHDKDYLALKDYDDEEYYLRRYIEEEDIVFRSKSNIERNMNFKLPLDYKTAMYYIWNYQLDKDIIGQDFPLEYHILDRRNDYIHLLNWIVDNKAVNFTKTAIFNGGHCSKLIYHIAYTAFIIQNNSTRITAEQKTIVQKIHDKQMPVEYLDELAEIIKGLK